MYEEDFTDQLLKKVQDQRKMEIYRNDHHSTLKFSTLWESYELPERGKDSQKEGKTPKKRKRLLEGV
ncbi:42960_t:CDS:2 [Gigaspora margarita]|uniref:42960_t:CDS:1 n=1 Tax=Gigaspora margarita TaxID=4874 RepID=A0ABN7VPG0_GIGMA|nr:42960_t:CDS:2 [Gigaspora margarita]